MDESHSGHDIEMVHGRIYLSLGWGHLEARLQTAFVQVHMYCILKHHISWIFSLDGRFYSKRAQESSVIELRGPLTTFSSVRTIIKPMPLLLLLPRQPLR